MIINKCSMDLNSNCKNNVALVYLFQITVTNEAKIRYNYRKNKTGASVVNKYTFVKNI